MNNISQFLKTSAVLAFFGLAVSASAGISISVDAEKLQDGSGGAMPTTGILLLVVSTEDDDFVLPTVDEFIPASSDDLILASWDLSDGGGVAGIFSGLASNLSYESGYDEGDPLMLYWFPNATKSSTGPGTGASYGLFRDDTGILTGSVWELPSDGTLLYALKFFTEDATQMAAGGDVPAFAGSAALPLGVALSPVGAPTGAVASNLTEGGVNVMWEDKANNEGGYLVERSVAGSGIWKVVGTALANATSFVDLGTTEKTSYEYRITAMNSVASSTEAVSAALLTSFGRIANISTRGQVLTGASILIGGFVIEGTEDKSVLIRAIGPQLGVYGVAGALTDPSIELYRSSDGPTEPPFAVNTNWENVVYSEGWIPLANAAEIALLTADLGGFPLEAGSKDAVVFLKLSPGGYTAKVKGVGGTTGVGLVEIYDADDAAVLSDVINISTRGNIGTAADILIAGFVIDGDRSKTVLVRGIGPTLGGFGVAGTITDPFLKIQRNQGGTLEDVATNDNWGDAANAAEIPVVSQTVGGFPLETGSADAAILITLPPGIYTAKLSGVGGVTGNGLVEVYRVQ
ncbi:MAG: hypothetical protein DRP71_07260 [Verrucomicrobia bacterium]|nr:MAG: hypothetical protein DRP71_07260 [Verrucomicrobiota bacterium]